MGNSTVNTELKLTKKEEVVETLKIIQKVYKRVFGLSHEEREHIILEGLLRNAKIELSKNPSKVDTYETLIEAIQELQKHYPEKSFPHDTTLMQLLRKKLPGYSGVPTDSFNQYMIVFNWADKAIDKCFDSIDEVLTDKQDRYVIKRLRLAIHNTLVDNPNFKVSEEYALPYYKRNFSEFTRSLKSSEQYLDADFKDWIEYFEDVLS